MHIGALSRRDLPIGDHRAHRRGRPIPWAEHLQTRDALLLRDRISQYDGKVRVYHLPSLLSPLTSAAVIPPRS